MSEGKKVRRGAAATAAIAMTAMLATSLLAGSSSAAPAPGFTAVGSAEQVNVTGLAPNAQASLLTPTGAILYTQAADSLGGLLFRNVPPGHGYHVLLTSDGSESGSLTVHSDAAAPWDPAIYNQTIADQGYQYLTTRDGTRLAIDVHPPEAPAGEPGAPPGHPPRRGRP